MIRPLARVLAGPSRRRHRKSPVMLAGWLFADLFLVLMLTALATQAQRVPKPPAPIGKGPDARRTSCPASYQLEPVELQLTNLSFSGIRKRDEDAVAQMIRQVKQQLKDKRADDQYAGLILAFGLAAYAHLGEAEDTAHAAGDILTKRLDRFRGAKVRQFKIEITHQNPQIAHGNQLTLDVYFFARC